MLAIRLGERSTLAGCALLKAALALLACWAILRKGQLLPLGRTRFLINLGRVGAVELVVAVTIASASYLVTRLWRWVEVGKQLPSVGRSWTSTNPLGRDRRYHAIHALLRSLVLIPTITFALLLVLHLLLLPRLLIKRESVQHRVNQAMFVCYTSTGIKTTLLIELGFW
jgi:hypothetical protein